MRRKMEEIYSQQNIRGGGAAAREKAEKENRTQFIVSRTSLFQLDICLRLLFSVGLP
jgi:hypothetical protein